MSVAARLGLPEDIPKPLLWAVCLYLWHLLCQGWVASSECFVFFTLVAVTICIYDGVMKPSFHILYYPLLVYGIASTLSAAFSDRRIHAFGESALWGKMLLLPAAIMLFRTVPRAKTLALYATLLFGASSSIFGLFQYFVLAQRDLEHRITGQAAHVMTYSGLMLPVSLLFFVLWLHDRRNLGLLACTLMTTVALLLTYTRSAWLGWIVAVFILFLLTRPLWMLYATVGLVYLVLLVPIPVFGRMVSTFNTKQASNLDRIRMVEAGIEIIKDYPLLGVGPANVKEVYPLYRKHDAPRFRIPHLHNNIIQIWAERGVLGLAAYVMFLALFLRECARAWNGPQPKWAEVGVVVTVGLAYAGLFEFNFGDTEPFFLMLDLFALVIAFTEAGSAVANDPGRSAVPVTRP